MTIDEHYKKRLNEASTWLRAKHPTHAAKLESLDDIEPHHIEMLEHIIRDYKIQEAQADKVKEMLDQHTGEYQQEGE